MILRKKILLFVISYCLVINRFNVSPVKLNHSRFAHIVSTFSQFPHDFSIAQFIISHFNNLNLQASPYIVRGVELPMGDNRTIFTLPYEASMSMSFELLEMLANARTSEILAFIDNSIIFGHDDRC